MNNQLVYLIVAMVFAGLVSFTMTPIARVLAYKVGAVDVPKDERRMHSKPIPRMGGIAVFIGFSIASMVFCEVTPSLLALWFGGLVIVAMGSIDDVFPLPAWAKLLIQIGVAFIPILQGTKIEFVNLFGNYITLGVFEIPVTVLWIVGLTNAINLIDGLDGLSTGVSAICSLSLLICTIMLGDSFVLMVLVAILAGSCLGFLPFNTNPAKIFIGDCGALFLGYTLAVLSIEGLFKFHAVLSFMIPLLIFGLPLFDTVFAFFRRILHGKNPFKGDKGHIHHRLIAIGFNQKQSVGILYAVCGILGISAVMFTSENLNRAGIIIIAGLTIFAVNYIIIKNPKTREQSGLDLPELPKAEDIPSDEKKTEQDDNDKKPD